jgi:hypothetical protein
LKPVTGKERQALIALGFAASAVWTAPVRAQDKTPVTTSQKVNALDLKGHTLLWLSDTTMQWDGKPISCPEVKARFPAFVSQIGRESAGAR